MFAKVVEAFQSKILFIVGAGASFEVGLPVGADLKKIIANKLDIQFDRTALRSGDLLIAKAIQSYNKNNGNNHLNRPFLDACWRIRDAMPQASSIDSFIDQQNDDFVEFCGKLAIVRSIIEAEQDSSLYVDLSKPALTIDFSTLDEKKPWHNKFMQFLVDGCRVDDLQYRLRRIKIVSFNYDRCIEHFLFHSIQNYYAISADRAAEILNSLEIHHPYGVVGRLPWQGGEGTVQFGGDLTVAELLQQADGIKTFTEQFDDRSALKKIHQAVIEARIVVFLGFAYHQQNLSLIKPRSFMATDAELVFGTSKGISKSDRSVVKEQVADLFGRAPAGPDIFIERDLTCRDLFDEYQRSIVLS